MGMRYILVLWYRANLIFSQEWYVGPIALKAGPAPFGADIGFELGFGATAILYPPLRFLEHRYFGR
jgi:hypothetical protein